MYNKCALQQVYIKNPSYSPRLDVSLSIWIVNAIKELNPQLLYQITQQKVVKNLSLTFLSPVSNSWLFFLLFLVRLYESESRRFGGTEACLIERFLSTNTDLCWRV